MLKLLSYFLRCLALLVVFNGLCAATPATGHWVVARNAHFAVYSHAGEKAAEKALSWFEHLRAFFQQHGLWLSKFSDEGRSPLHIVGFSSQNEYAEYQVRPYADAYYAAQDDIDYIVMANLDSKVAAHEYTHYVVRLSGLTMPACFREGLAEFFSTLRVSENGYQVGGSLPGRTQVLQTNKWLPLVDLLSFNDEAALTRGRKEAEIFYAESWALVDMLIVSPKYGPKFRDLIMAFNNGTDAMQALRYVYGKSITDLSEDLEDWVGRPQTPKLILSRPAGLHRGEVKEISAAEQKVLEAQLSLVSGRLEQARNRYAELLAAEPNNPAFAGMLGTITERQGNRGEALKFWRQAVDNHVMDANVCFRYAMLAEEAGADRQDIKAALERALFLVPGFDDARFKLALLQYHEGEYKSAIDHLRAMAVPGPNRLYAYWIALASALLESKQNEEAQAAAAQAEKAAQNDADKMTARNIALMAATVMTVQFSTDSEGHTQMVTTRVPHGTTDWNPFIEPSDQIEHAEGKLNEVLCTKGKLTGFLMATAKGKVTLEVADPFHVLMRNGPSEFYCGPMSGSAVTADYAVVQSAGKTRNVLRGMTFEQR